MTALEEIKKALEGVTPERVERLWWFLHILAKSTGTTNAEDDKWNWINAFCTDYEDDTFNFAAKLGFITVRHDSFMETSTARITKAGMALVAHFDKAPSAALTFTLEILQRENEELRQRLDIGPHGEDAIDVAESAAQHLLARAEAAEAEVKRLTASRDGYKRGRDSIQSEYDRLRASHSAEVEALNDKIEGISADLDSAVDVAFNRGADEWVRMNYPDRFEKLSRTALASTGGEHNAE